ncbi:MAG: hypothetical protein C4519_13250 [Desulfobacteraceae bacterium]|nr:MAG: hypothetical protein C4519_13250 [Desulfobacteraceae bacterium]
MPLDQRSFDKGCDDRRPQAVDPGPIMPLPRLSRLRADSLSSDYHLCTRKAELLTDYFRAHHDFSRTLKKMAALHFKLFARSLENTRRGKVQKRWQVALNTRLARFYLKREGIDTDAVPIAYARGLAHILERTALTVYDHELIVGNPSSHRIGAPIHPDLAGVLLMPELEEISNRRPNPLKITQAQIRLLKEEVFPFWFNRSVLCRVSLYSRDPELFNRLLEGCYYILTQFSGIAHITPDYQTLLQKGFAGIREEIMAKCQAVEEQISAARKSGGAAGSARSREMLSKRAFYQAGLIVADAAIAHAKRWAEHLSRLAAAETDPARKAELTDMAAIFMIVPEKPAETFHQALQSVFITHVMLHQESFQHGMSFGRMDQYLAPYYQRELAAGGLTRQRATELLGCFLIKSGELLPLFFERATPYFSGMSSASGITLGGGSADASEINELSYLMLQAYDQVRLRQPNLHVRLTAATPPAFLRLCCRVLKRGGGMPAFFNDAAVIPTLQRVGFSPSDAHDYAIVGCVEWGVPGKSFPAAGAVFLNLPMALHLALHNGVYNGRQVGPCTGALDELTGMEQVKAAVAAQLDAMIESATEGNNAIETTHARHRPTPLLSILIDGCTRCGKEVNAGGAVYNTTGFQGVGMADLADALLALEAAVFKEKKISLRGLIGAADADFAGREPLRQYIINRLPKYGQNDPDADRWVHWLSAHFTQAVFRKKNSRGGHYLPGFWSMTTHQGFGAMLPALPSGRRAGEPLANGASPVNGRSRFGPTASLASAAALDTRLIGNGYALNQQFNRDMLAGEAGDRLLGAIILGYFKMGGMQVQFNIVDPGVLIEAKQHPEKHPDLVVRVSGYSAYFNDLTESMKDEIIQRLTGCATDGGCACG